ncbi:MAG: tetratricopeptide repeat protein [Desulfobulbus sp.]
MKHNAEFLSGQRHFLRGEYGRSIIGFGKALESGMDPARVYLPLGLAYFKNSNFAEAETELSRALELDAKNDHLLFLRAMARFNRGDLGNALDDLNGSLRLNPRRSVAYVGRSLVLRAMHRDNEAELDLQAAVGIGGVEAELFMREYCLAPSLQNLAMSLLDVDRAAWGDELRTGGSTRTH